MLEKIVEYIKEERNFEEVLDIVTEINSYDGSLEYMNYYYNDEDFFLMYYENNPMEAVRATYYGDYKFMDDFVGFNGYGNLVSLDKWELENEYKDNAEDIANRIIELGNRIYLPSEIEEILEEEEIEEE